MQKTSLNSQFARIAPQWLAWLRKMRDEIQQKIAEMTATEEVEETSEGIVEDDTPDAYLD